MAEVTRPYADAAPLYWEAGWRGVLPLPVKAKWPPPDDYTGHDGLDASFPDVHAWTQSKPSANIALRLPDGVIGIDVDAYDGKVGGQTYDRWERQHGALPATWTSSSRSDGVSSIRLYRVRTGRAWLTKLIGGGVEIIQRAHRYAVVWPSVHDKTGATYQWRTPEGALSPRPPRPDELTELPQAWQDALSRGDARTGKRSEVDNTQAAAWLEALPTGEPCKWVLKRRQAAVAALDDGRHEATLAPLLALLYAGAKKHPGVQAAVEVVRAAFLEAVSDDRGEKVAEDEWDRSLNGGLAVIADDPPDPDDVCRCSGSRHKGAAVRRVAGILGYVERGSRSEALQRLTWGAHRFGEMAAEGAVDLDEAAAVLHQIGNRLGLDDVALLGDDGHGGAVWTGLRAGTEGKS